MFEFLPQQLKNLSNIQLYASIVWIALIILFPITILLVKPIKGIFKDKTPDKINNDYKSNYSKGFKDL